ncbi:MAG: putative cytosol aminopeptidase [Chlamydiota bacterium]|jgi:leucyl aminopeptidase
MVKLSIASLKSRKSAGAVIVPFFLKKKGEFAEFEAVAKGPLEIGDFSGKEKEALLLYHKGHEPRVLLLGLGEEKKCTEETVRGAYAHAVKVLRSKSIFHLNVCLPSVGMHGAAIEGLLMAAYRFDFKSKSEEKPIESICLCGKVAEAEVKKVEAVMRSVYLTRDLVNGNADDVNVDALIKKAKELSKAHSSLKLTVLDKKALQKEKMGLILAVGQAAERDPAVIILEYRGNPSSKEQIAVVGKGVTFDTGGLNIKVSGSGMETMKCDMAGAAVVMGIMQACAELKLKVNLVGAMGVAENAIGPKSYKPGDVFVGYTGQSVEITNTDAEGRLVLADTIAYLEKHYKCTSIVDFATLTGGVIIALGEDAAGLFSNNDKLSSALEKAADRTGERLWRLPLYPEYRDYLKSPIADIKNSGGARRASAGTGATFIHAFVKGSSWAHIDIAGVAYPSELKHPYHPTLATGYGVRLFIDFLTHECI